MSDLLSKPQPIHYVGERGIDHDEGSIGQIETAMRLPVAVRGALMVDSHVGYGLPIGGVVALDNAVSPNFVGVDIGCRMSLSFLDISQEDAKKNREQIATVMQSVSRFGVGSHFEEPRQHDIMNDPRWGEEPMKNLKDKAQSQLGSSGGGNHFFNLMVGTAMRATQYIPQRNFVAIMTHSGSRGVGHSVARYFGNLAVEELKNKGITVPKGYEFLYMDTLAGQAYWEAMQLMLLYAKANHDLIHEHFIKESGISSLGNIENHHNFADKDEKTGLYIIRKGATPAKTGVVAIIPGSSGTSSYIVRGLGCEQALNSSAHGAGRLYSRSEAKKRHNSEAYEAHMKEHDILAIGVAADESCFAYKDIQRIMDLQSGYLVQPLAEMTPLVTIMGGGKRQYKKNKTME